MADFCQRSICDVVGKACCRRYAVCKRRKLMAKLNINGTPRDVQVESDTPLLWVIREHVGLTGTKYGCGIPPCGACTVHIDGVAVRSCSLPVSAVEGKQITTIEGLAQNGTMHPVQKAWA